VIAAGLVVAWRFNARVKFLIYAAGVLVVMGLIWVLTLFVTSDSKQLENNVREMASAIEAGRMDDLFQHVSKDFHYKELSREGLYAVAQKAMAARRVNSVAITQFRVDEASRTNKFAKTRFQVTIHSRDMDRPYIFVTEGDFVLEGDAWKLKTMRFKRPLVNQDEEISLPGL
jgi:hypothetical protein